MKLHGVLHLIILFAFDSCDCKCDEYIIVLKETACIGGKYFDTMKLTDVKLNELAYNYNSTRLYDDTISFKECIFEVECDCSNTNTCLERETEQTETEDKTKYDLNIINVNTKNDSDHINNNITRDKMFMVYCDYAENSCEADVGNENNTKYIDVSKIATLKETVKDLQITLKRDEGSVIQPIFTGFSSKQSKTGSSNKTFLDVNLICKYKQNIHCKSERKAKNTSKEILTKPNKTINVYLKSAYIKNNTEIKYTGCRKQLGDSEYSLSIECDATDFTYINKDILFISPNSSEHETVNLHCQITESNLSTEANLLNFNNCYVTQHFSNSKNFHNQSLTLFINKNIFTENSTTTINDFTTLKVPLIFASDEKSYTDEKNWVKIRITPEESNNCSQNQIVGITEGKIIDKGVNFIINKIPNYENVDVKLLNCYNGTNTINNNVTSDSQSTKLFIILKNETDLSEIDEELEETITLDSIIIVCNQTSLAEQEHINKNDDGIALTCKYYMEVNYTTTTKNNSSGTTPQISKEEKIPSHEENKSIIDEEHQDNCVSNSTEKTICPLECSTEKTKECNRNFVNETSTKNNGSVDQNDLTNNYESTVGGNKTNDDQSKRKDEFTIESETPLDRIGLILLVTIAAVGLLLAVTLRKCARKGRYSPAPVREPQDLEDTAF